MNSADQERLLTDTEDALKLLRSDEWKQYIVFLKGRARKLQDDVNDAVQAGNMDEAKVALAVMKDSKKQTELFIKHVMNNKEQLERDGVR